MADNTYDAIVIGSGISGGWAAKELTEKGLKTLLLERGRRGADRRFHAGAVSRSVARSPGLRMRVATR